MCSKRFLVAFTAISMALAATNASAVPITFEFGGTVTEIIDNTGVLAGDVVVGDAFSGSYTFDSTLSDSYPDPAVGLYASADSVMHVSVGAFDLLSGDEHLITIEDGTTHDTLALGASNFTSDGVSVAGMVAILNDSSGSVFSSDSLPLSAPPLSAFDEAGLQIEARRAQGDPVGFAIVGYFDRFVPEPGSISMLLLGSLALQGRRRVL